MKWWSDLSRLDLCDTGNIALQVCRCCMTLDTFDVARMQLLFYSGNTGRCRNATVVWHLTYGIAGMQIWRAQDVRGNLQKCIGAGTSSGKQLCGWLQRQKSPFCGLLMMTTRNMACRWLIKEIDSFLSHMSITLHICTLQSKCLTKWDFEHGS